jgi:TldD protein
VLPCSLLLVIGASPLATVARASIAHPSSQRHLHHAHATPAASPVLLAMSDELSRSMQTLKSQPAPPYFLSYQISESQQTVVHGSFGALESSTDGKKRTLTLDMRVGSPSFDNTHVVRGGMPSMDFGERLSRTLMPAEDDPAAIRRILWYTTDRRYKRAVERLARAKADVEVHVATEDSSADFAVAPKEEYIEALAAPVVDRRAWENKVRLYTAPFAKYDDIYDGEATLWAEGATRWYVNSDGSRLQTSSTFYRLIISAYTKADDGMILPRYESFLALTPDKLPNDSEVSAAVARMIADMHALKKAPVIGAMTAPAILSGRASGVFFHEVFGHRIEGHRLKNEEDAQTFKGRVGQHILPSAISIYFDPTQRTLGGTDLAGFYLYDDQGVKAHRVDVVTNGVFRNFLMSRSPIAGFSASNGHGRAQPGFTPVARQSNLVVTGSAPVSRAELKRRLLAEVKAQHKPFGLLFDDIEGGFTITQRFVPNAFNVLPIMVYRVFPDGREELVRGIDLIGTPLTVFSRIIATDGEQRVFNGVCGAESGGVPVSAASPAILLSQIEVQKKQKDQDRAPILPAPHAVQP